MIGHNDLNRSHCFVKAYLIAPSFFVIFFFCCTLKEYLLGGVEKMENAYIASRLL